jgi:hypothetical protein
MIENMSKFDSNFSVGSAPRTTPRQTRSAMRTLPGFPLSPQSSVLSPAFTLVEVMISLFLVLILLVGINTVFKTTSEAVSAGQNLGEQVRNARAVQPELFGDLANCATDSPAFIISSSMVPQYLNAADATANSAAAGSLPNLPNIYNTAGNGPGLGNCGCILGDHLHRCDMLSFFVRGALKRKTANGSMTVSGNTFPGSLASTTTSDEAWVHYGHLRTSSDGITFIGPDDYAGTSEPYAADWVLGRNQILMVEPNYVQPNEPDLAFHSETYYPNVTPTAPAPVPNVLNAPWSTPTYNINGQNYYVGNLTPLGYNSGDYNYNAAVETANVTKIQSSRYDLAGVTINQFRSIIQSASTLQYAEPSGTTQNPYVFWWSPLIYQQPPNEVLPASAPYPPLTPQITRYYGTNLSSTNLPPTPYDTSTPLVYFVGSKGATNANGAVNNQWFPKYRFQGSTALSTSPMGGASGSSDQAGLSPYFLEHVSQFIVEYAGDFVSQDAVGDVTDTVPDGQIDWVYATKGDWYPTTNYSPGDYVIYKAPNASSTAYWQAVSPFVNVAPGATAGQWIGNVTPPKQIRWYGMPRDSSGSGHVWSYYHPSVSLASLGGVLGKTPPNSNSLNNVVPLVDVWQTSENNATRPVPYETEVGPTLLDTNPPTGGTGQTTAGVEDYAYDAAAANSSGALGSDPTQGVVNANGDVTNTGIYFLARYTAVFQNTVPAMVRILIKVDDPNNAVQNGPWFEYVFKLK